MMIDAKIVYDRAFNEGLKPDPLLTISEWADMYRVLSKTASSEPGRYRTSRTPPLQEIMDCLSPYSPVEILNIVEEGDIVEEIAIPMHARQKKALLNVLNYLADEEQHFHNEPDCQENHIWLDREILREMMESVPQAKPDDDAMTLLAAILPYAECEVEYRQEQGKECPETHKEWEEALPLIQKAQKLLAR